MSDNAEFIAPKPIMIAVRTIDLSTGRMEGYKEVDHARHEDRVWMSKHLYWALRNQREVQMWEIDSKAALEAMTE